MVETNDPEILKTGPENLRKRNLTQHKFENLGESGGKNALIFDGRRYFTNVEIREIISRGLSYTGVGR